MSVLILNLRSCAYKFGSQSCPTLCDSLDYSLSGSSALRVFQARILEWIAFSSS